jgi:NAD(P)-dependent dehydrogenase (short-subunit alcohol dehydrogenase family)
VVPQWPSIPIAGQQATQMTVQTSVSSTGARLAGSGPFDYNVLKAALNALTKVIAEQFGAEGVRAITVSPGPVATGVWTDPDAPSHGWPSRTASTIKSSQTNC